MEIAIILIALGVIVITYAAYQTGKRHGKPQGYIEAAEYYREHEKYLNEMADGYCEYLSKEYDRLKKQLSDKREVH